MQCRTALSNLKHSLTPTSCFDFQHAHHFVSPNKCQAGVVRWLLENGVDREKACYYGQRPLDVIGQCRLDTQAASDIHQALTDELKREYIYDRYS